MNNINDQVLSIGQMQEFQKLGINISNASMCWIGCSDGNDVYPYNSTFKDIFEGHKETIPTVLTPTFTLQDILEMLPERIIINGYVYTLTIKYHTVILYYDYAYDKTLRVYNHGNILNAAFDMLKWCKQNKHI